MALITGRTINEERAILITIQQVTTDSISCTPADTLNAINFQPKNTFTNLKRILRDYLRRLPLRTVQNNLQEIYSLTVTDNEVVTKRSHLKETCTRATGRMTSPTDE